MNRICFTLLAGTLLTLTNCADPYDSTLHPDYAIRVVPTEHGSVAVPPTCPTWDKDIADPFDNQPYPEYGCANARNLAAMVERPEDLVDGRTLDDARGVNSVGAVRRYDNNQTRGLIMPASDSNVPAATTAATATSTMTGDVTGGTGAASTAPPATAAAP